MKDSKGARSFREEKIGWHEKKRRRTMTDGGGVLGKLKVGEGLRSMGIQEEGYKEEEMMN